MIASKGLSRRAFAGAGIATAFAASLMFTASAQTSAQSWPKGPIKIVVPYAPGGASDIIARLIAPELEKALGYSFLVDNRAGGASMIGTQAIASTPVDGDIIGVIDSAFVINPGLFRDKMRYDTKKDFSPISLLVTSPLVLVVHPSVQAKTVKELVDLAKAQPGSLKFAHAGLGTAIHLAGEQFRQAAGINIVQVPYKGGGPAITDTLGGQVHMTIATVPAIAQQVEKGLVRALAVTGNQRVPQLKDVPTMTEAGLPAVDAQPLFGLVASANLPPAAVTRLSEIASNALKSDPLKSRVTELGFVAVGSTPAEFRSRIDNEIAKWSAIIQKGNIQPE